MVAMSQRFLILLGIVALISGLTMPSGSVTASPAFEPSPVRSKDIAQVRYIRNGLSEQPPRQPRHKGRVKDRLYTGYRLGTGASQRASLGFIDRSMLHINQRTELVLRSPHLTQVKKGEIYEVISPGTKHTIQTAAAVASAIGTAFDVRIRPGPREQQNKKPSAVTEVVVAEGTVEVTSKQGKVVVRAGQETVVRQGTQPSKPAAVDVAKVIGWTQSIPPPTKPVDLNLALDANGGTLVDTPTEWTGDNNENLWQAEFAHDGQLNTGWASDTGQVSDETFDFKLPADRLYTLSSIVIDPAATHGLPDSADLQHFTIAVSSTTDDPASFVEIFHGTCQRRNALQTFPFPTAFEARYVQITADDNYGNPDHIAIAEIEIAGTPVVDSPGTWHSFVDEGLLGPQGLAADASGNIYVADASDAEVQKYSPSGHMLAAYGGTGSSVPLHLPVDVALDPAGNIFVVDAGDSRVVKLSPSGSLIKSFSQPGSGPGDLSTPQGLSTDTYGNVYVADTGNDRVEKFSNDGGFLQSFGVSGSGLGQFDSPSDVAVNKAGNLYVVDTGNNRIQKLAPDGRALAQIGTEGTAPGQLFTPSSITLDGIENLWITDTGNDRVQEFSQTGKLVGRWGRFGSDVGQFHDPEGIVVDASGQTYVSDASDDRVQLLSP